MSKRTINPTTGDQIIINLDHKHILKIHVLSNETVHIDSLLAGILQATKSGGGFIIKVVTAGGLDANREDPAAGSN